MRNQSAASAAKFTFNGHLIRHIKLDNKTWFSASDVAKANGITAAVSVYRPVPSAHKRSVDLDTGRGTRPCIMIDIDGLAFAAVRLSLVEFEKWISTSEAARSSLERIKSAPASEAKALIPVVEVSGREMIFSFSDDKVRTVIDIDNNPWFIAKDVCAVLGLGNVTNAIQNIPDKHIAVINVKGDKGTTVTNIIDEPGMYRMAMRSKKPNAERFIEWITAEVIPSIRKTGGYSIPQDLPSALRLAADLGEKAKRLEEKIEHDAPKVQFASQVEESTTTVTMAQLAKLLCKRGYNIGRNRLFDFLKAKEILMFNREPYQRYLNQGWFEVREITTPLSRGGIVIQQTLVTGKGQLAIAELIRKEQVRLTAPIASVQRRLAA